jgi:7tm Odorant receptor
MKLFTYLIPIIVEMLMPCYVGNDLTLAIKKLPESLFHSNWTDESKEFKKTMVIFMENTKKSIKVSAFGVFELSLENFLKIINSAYSLYAVFKTLKS